MLDSVHESPLGDVPSKKTSCNKIVNCDRATACVVLDLGCFGILTIVSLHPSLIDHNWNRLGSPGLTHHQSSHNEKVEDRTMISRRKKDDSCGAA